MNVITRFAPWLGALVGVAWFGVAVMPPRTAQGDFDLAEFGTIPVVEGGRLKPLDTAARTDLMVISAGRQTFKSVPYGAEGGTSLPATKWLLDVWNNLTPFDGPGTRHQVIRVENDQVLNLLGLKLRPEFYRYSPAEIRERYGRFEREYHRVDNIDAKARDPYEQMINEVGRRLALYEALARRRSPLVVPPARDGEDWTSLFEVDDRATDGLSSQLKEQYLKVVGDQLKKDKRRISDDELGTVMEKIDREVTQQVRDAAAPRRAIVSPAAAAFVNIVTLYGKGDAAGFNSAVADYKAKHLDHVSEGDQKLVRFEAFFNRVDPFFHCQWQYVLVFGLGCLSWMGPSFRGFARAAGGLALVTLAVHTSALIGRMVIQGRPPITNLYSSAVYIGWGCLLIGLILEAIYRNGIGLSLAGMTGFIALQIADRLGSSGDTLEMMQAVLDTNIWLATHVTAVTSGYVATYVAGFIGIRYILQGVLTRTQTVEKVRETNQMIYGVVCFATLLSFVGTVLGGIWADQSWGRFWGWDPKENGALLVVIWNALILHARWSGMVKQRGLAVLATLGCIVATWSWFGTNQLGVGLHAYGFRNDIAFWVVTSSILFLAIAGLGALPQFMWRSYEIAPTKPRRRSEKTVPVKV